MDLEMVLEDDPDGEQIEAVWFEAGPVQAFPQNGGACVKIGPLQIAIFNFTHRDEWYACQNLCPHRQEMALSRGLVGSIDGVPKVACPFHKSTFSLETGVCMNADVEPIRTYPVRVDDGLVFVDLAGALRDDGPP
jgi:nitrite reductase (NADH) small subunit